MERSRKKRWRLQQGSTEEASPPIIRVVSPLKPVVFLFGYGQGGAGREVVGVVYAAADDEGLKMGA